MENQLFGRTKYSFISTWYLGIYNHTYDAFSFPIYTLVSTSFFPSKIVGGLSQGNFKNCYLHEISSSISFDSL